MQAQRRDGHLSWDGLGKTTAWEGEGLRDLYLLGLEEKMLVNSVNKYVCLKG